MKLIVNTEYVDLLRFIFSEYREEKRIPFRDNFFLIKNITSKEIGIVERFSNCIIVSSTYFEAEWGRKEIFEYVAEKIKSRRKPKFDLMSKEEFEKNVKVFMISKTWLTEDEESGVFELYKNLDSIYRFKTYFELRVNLQPYIIFYSILTFVNKTLTITDPEVAGKGYFRIMQSMKRRIQSNFKKALTTYSNYDRSVDDSFKCLRFLMDIGG
jgi:hypothetical protein